MLKVENEYYVRYILLLLKGGSQALQNLLIHILKKQNVTLEKFLDENRETLSDSDQISDSQRDLLYPPSGNQSDITQWDSSLLISIILTILREDFSETEITSVEKLRDIRKAFFAQTNEAVIDVRKFPKLWCELSLVITTICHSLSERSYFNDLISSISSSDIDTNAAVQELQVLGKTDEFSDLIETNLHVLGCSHHESDLCQVNTRSITEEMEQVSIGEAEGVNRDTNDCDKSVDDDNDSHSTGSDTDSVQSKREQDIGKSTKTQITESKEKKKKRKKSKKNPRKDKKPKRQKIQLSSVEEAKNDTVAQKLQEEEEMKEKLSMENKAESSDEASKMVFGAYRPADKIDLQITNSDLPESSTSLFVLDKETDKLKGTEADKETKANKEKETSVDVKDMNPNKRRTRSAEPRMSRTFCQSERRHKCKASEDDDGYDVDTGFDIEKNDTANTEKGQSSSSNTEKRSMKSNTTADGGHSHRSTQSGSREMVHVQFHVLISPNFELDRQAPKVAVGIRKGNEWDVNTHHMEFVKKHHGGLMQMTHTLELPKNTRLFYKYFVLHSTKYKKENNISEGEWEHYFARGNPKEESNRVLQIAQTSEKSFIHQFDGIANKKPGKSFVSWITNHFQRNSKLQNDACNSAKIFAKETLQQMSNANESAVTILRNIETTNSLIQNLKKMYVTDAVCFKSEDEMTKKIGNHIFDPVFKIFKELSSHETAETENQWKQRMAIQFFLLDLWKRMKLGNQGLPLTERQKLCKAFLISTENNFSKNTCKELAFINDYFPSKKDIFKDALLSLAETVVSHAKDPSWLYLMPLVHFLSGRCSPYDEKSDNIEHDAEVPTWWGISLANQVVKKFKEYGTQRWGIPLQDMLETLFPLFEADYLLPRTIMACLNLDELYNVISSGKIPVEVCNAALIFYLKSIQGSYNYGKGITRAEQEICKCIKSVYGQLQQESIESNRNAHMSWLLPLTTARDLLFQALRREGHEIVSNSILVFLQCASNQYFNPDAELPQLGVDDIASCCDETFNWLSRYYSQWHTDLEKSFQVWNDCLIPEAVLSEKVEHLWNGLLVDALKQKMQEFMGSSPRCTECIVTMYCKKIESFSPAMQACLHDIALQAIVRECNIDILNLDEKQQIRYGRLLSKMFASEWTKMMKNIASEDSRQFLEQILGWRNFPKFYTMFATKQHLRLLEEECQNSLTRAVSVIETYLVHLLNGSLDIGALQLMCKDAKKFAELASFIKTEDQEITKEGIHLGIQIRKKELDTYLLRADLLVSLMSLCKQLPKVDMSCIAEVLQQCATVEKHNLDEYCKPVAINSVKNIDDFEPELTKLKLPEQIDVILNDMHSLQKSSVFMRLWNTQCKQSSKECEKLVDILKIWMPVHQRWKDISCKVKSGEILFCEFEEHISREFGEDYKKIERELKLLEVTEDIVNIRVEQLKKYRHLEACTTGAASLLQFKTEYNLKGDFEQIDIIADNKKQNIQISQFDDTLMDACEFLEGFNDKNARCLETFLGCKPLVHWLKETMQTSGLKELQVFVDLASMSIGDDPYNIGKVQALHSAVTGYAPLIFDLKDDCDCKGLLRLCKLVWRELKANPKLPKQLEDTNGQIEWLKEVKNAHGVVEVTSMMQTDAINSYGTYTVGQTALQEQSKTSFSDKRLTLADSVRLVVPGEKGKRQLRNYTFSELQDLQSRLMLVAGKADKGTESVERFTMILDSVTRLSKVYVNLNSSGCVLFKDWSARFICDPDPTRPVCTIISFGQGSEVQQLKGRRSVNEDLKDMIPKIARFMESCHKEWLQHINEKRKAYVELNYFTVDQLVILQQELVKFGTDDQPSHLIYPLLSSVKADCSEDDIVEAMRSVKRQIGREDSMDVDTDSDSDISLEEDSEESVQDVVKQAFIQGLVEAGQYEGTAVKALAAGVDPEDLQEGILWCIEHCDSDMSDEENKDEQESMDTKSSVKQAFGGWSQSDVSMQNLINVSVSKIGKHSKVGTEPLIQDLCDIWNTFLKCISSNVRDYLNVEHLGRILQALALKDSKEVSRSLLPGLKEGSPNLIVCPADEVLTTALSIYMVDNDQLLPQSDEILLCTHTTTIDEVDIFLRRAFYDGGKKIHCILNADFLDYEVCEAAQRSLKEYLQDLTHTEKSYRLCVICSQENEYRSALVSYLDKYRMHTPPISREKLRKYIAKRLILPQKGEYDFQPAAFVDIERSSVRVIKSSRAGVGKTLYKTKMEQALLTLHEDDDEVSTEVVSIPLHEKKVDINFVIYRLLDHTLKPGEKSARLFHIDIGHDVLYGVDYLLFNLLILGCLTSESGYVWRKSKTDLYLIETMSVLSVVVEKQELRQQSGHPMLSILPEVICRSPQESLFIYNGRDIDGMKQSDQLFDDDEFRSQKYQIPFQYLCRLGKTDRMNDVTPEVPQGDKGSCLAILLKYCGITDPSWSELHHFVWFLNTQLVDFRQNNFVSPAAAGDLPGFSTFVLRFLIQMSKDFSTRSLKISEESPGHLQDCKEMIINDDADFDETDDNILQLYQMRRTWESSPHPYLFFNSDRFTFTFLGFNIEKATGNLIDQQTGHVLEECIMQSNLYEALERNHVPLRENFNTLPREEKIRRLHKVMDVLSSEDPDSTYELTTDNVKKIMAIYMRFRCDIPVIIMGETGCGKTRLVKFLCGLQIPEGKNVTNLVLMKVHGGTTNKDIVKKVREAQTLAKSNRKTFGQNMYTVLFLDEANSTEAIGLIKEIMCDKSMEGEKLQLCNNLKIVAACNPYRKHTEELIKKLEQAGLGYHVDADETTDKLGRVPMRRLVYRVQPLPQSLLPLVWDFGQLNTQVEDLYIRQMVKRHIRGGDLPDITGLAEVISAVLTASQDYMRRQKDECSFVSLRDVERVLTVMAWFYGQSQEDRLLYNLMDTKLYGDSSVVCDAENSSENENAEDAEGAEGVEDDEDFADSEEEITEEGNQKLMKVTDVTRSLILALGVCYHACLKTREQYRTDVAQYFRAPLILPNGQQQILEEIDCCQDVFLDHVDLEKNIARNLALKENVFMMIVCIELRIPLFLIGKPGSSKSLAKTIVSDAMRGNAAKHELFKRMKQVQMASFQCSPLSTADGIVGTFKQCAQFQKDKNLDTFVSVVVLDEVGLAEDSPRMPLKALHPLLEEGYEEEDDEDENVADNKDPLAQIQAAQQLQEDGDRSENNPSKYKKVAFIGISNWALDPAKMNRGIIVQREVPDIEELISSARGICSTDEEVLTRMDHLIEPMAESYLELFNTASQKLREFFGLRDFYSLVKMVFSFVETSKQEPTWHQMLHAIRRNFEGLDQVDPVECFKTNLAKVMQVDDEPQEGDPGCTSAELIRACVFDSNKLQSESRYLLLLTEDYGALTIIQQLIFEGSEDIRPITIFGSSFRCDQEYTQVCLNINKIKVCMETGNTVVLLNLENLYESLYDALNQYYVYFGDVRYVDLGLGTHRVKCPVHPKFRLIVIAEKDTVYKKFPIPLINRLEKHFLTINTMLSVEQRRLASKLEQWANDFACQQKPYHAERNHSTEIKVGDVFIGYHEDSCSAIILHVYQMHSQEKDVCENKILDEAKLVLLWSATPDSLWRLEKNIALASEKDTLIENYHQLQAHNNILDYIRFKISHNNNKQLFSQVTTHSKLMSAVHVEALSLASGVESSHTLLLETLSTFDTEQQFSNKIRQHMKTSVESTKLIVIQCDSGNVNANLIACARYSIMGEFEKLRDELRAPVHVVLVVQLPKVSGGCFTGFQCGRWHSVHIDDLLPEEMDLSVLKEMHGKSVPTLIEAAVVNKEIKSTESIIYERAAPDEDMDTSTYEEQSADVTTTPELESTQEIMEVDDSWFHLDNAQLPEQLPYQTEQNKAKLDVKMLVLSCLQSALSMVKNTTEGGQRETDRVDLVIKLIHQGPVEGQMSFLQGICVLIANILKEKEKKTGATHRATHWLVNEAASLENINKAGNFRSSCIKVLESKLSPILAGIIAYFDTNANLSILQETQQPWKQKLWLKILNTPSVVDLQYQEFKFPVKYSELNEVTVLSTGFEGQEFCAKVPFSWLFIAKIDEVLNLRLLSEEMNNDLDCMETMTERADIYRRVLSENPLGVLFDDIQEEQIVKEATSEYICDMIQTKYPVKTREEFEVVFDWITTTTSQLQGEGSANNLLTSVIYVHLAFEALSSRLTYFQMLNVSWPECSSSLISFRKEKPNHYLFEENEMTFAGVCILMENLSPAKGALDDEEGRAVWLSNVHHHRSIVEKVISLFDDNATVYGANASKIVWKIKSLWARVMVVKLFIEHVCISEADDKMPMKFCTALWTLLGDEADMKNIESITMLEKFLKNCNKAAIKHYLGSLVECSCCEKDIEGVPVTLPCEHVLCDRCYSDLVASEMNSCSKCQVHFPGDWVPKKTNNAEERFKDYQKRCNTFFMDVVSQLIFGGKTAPSDKVIEKLLNYAFFATQGCQRTKSISIFDTGIDPNPVLRSFLLQQLLQTSETTVMANLEKYMSEVEAVVSEDVPDKEDIYLMVIHCIEDKLKKDCSKDVAKQIMCADKALKTAALSVIQQDSMVELLYGLASARMGLEVAADVIARFVKKHFLDDSESDLLHCARHFCENSGTNWPRTYLVKYLCRFHGSSVYQAACSSQHPDIQWIAFIEMDKVVRDRFIVSGETYVEIREAITKCLLEKNIENLQEFLMDILGSHAEAEPLIHLALYRVVISSYLHPQMQEKIDPEVLLKMSPFIEECEYIHNKELLKRIVGNQLFPGRLITSPNQNLRQQGILCLLVHFQTVMVHLNGDFSLFNPLKTLIEAPEECTNFFLPTMPQDDLEDIKKTLQALKKAGQMSDQELKFYRCPNGHPYVIGDCGRPYVISKCSCGADIGGTGHKLLESNTVDEGKDSTMTGHILGPAEMRDPGPKPDRSMTPAQCAVLRLFVHMAMYLGVSDNEEGIKDLIKPAIVDDQVEKFLYDHIDLDIGDISRAFTRSEDDVFIFLHCVIDGIMKTKECHSGNAFKEDECQLVTKKGRQEWEVHFIKCILQDKILDMDGILQNSIQMIINDRKLGGDPLLSLLYEVDENSPLQDASLLHEAPRVWRYRTPLSLQHLRQRLEAESGSSENTQKKYKVLELFLNEEYHLRALQFIPSILRLQHVLIQRFQKKLAKAEADKMTVAHLKRDGIVGSETAKLLADLAEAWQLCRETLRFYPCTTESGIETLPEEYCRQCICDNTPVSVLLPSSSGAGLCTYVLLDFLMRKQNDFLDKYLKETGRKLASATKVPPKELTSAHLISYDSQHDLLPMVLANCKYTFKLGEGTHIRYDFGGLERQLMDRFFFSISVIDIGAILQIDQMIYRTEFTNASVFRKLSEYIKQENLSASVKAQVSDEMKTLPEICQSLYNLDVAISFLKSTGGRTNQNLHKYMKETLQMETTIASQKAQQKCQFKHIQSLWLLLSLLKSKTMTDNLQPRRCTFESVQSVFGEDLEETEIEVFNSYLQDLSVKKLGNVVEFLHEFILLRLGFEQRIYEEDFFDDTDKRLKDWLLAYIEEVDIPPVDTVILTEFPEEIKLRHCVHAWFIAYNSLKGKQNASYNM